MLGLINLICLVNKVAEKRFLLVLHLELLKTVLAHVLQFLIEWVLVLDRGLRRLVLRIDHLLRLLGLLPLAYDFLECLFVSRTELMIQIHGVDRGFSVRGGRGVNRRSLEQC